MTSAQFHTGPVGSGSVTKVAVNAVLATLNQGVAEGLLIAEAGDLDPKVFYGVLRNSAAGAPYVGYKEDAFLSPVTAGVAATVSLIHKDVGLAKELAAKRQVSLPGVDAAYSVLEEALAAGLGNEDMAQVLAALRLRNGRGQSVTEKRDHVVTNSVAASDVEATIRALEDVRYAAVIDGEIETFVALSHPDLAYTHSDATTDTLESYREKLRSGFYVYHRIDHPVDRIVVSGDTAVVVGEMHAEITAGGKRKTLANKSLAVWVREGDDWRLLAFQPTVLPERAR